MELIPGLAGVPVAHSEISDIDGERGILEYRGYNIHQLVDNSTFLETAYLLIYGRLPNMFELSKFDNAIVKRQKLKFRIVDCMKNLPDSAHPMCVLQSMTALLSAFYQGDKIDEQTEFDTITRLLAKIPVIVANWTRLRRGDYPIIASDELTFAENVLYMLSGKVPDTETAEIFDKCLILHAEHTMNASTFATMVVASTLADPYKAISSAIGSLSGALHGGANEEVVKMLQEIGEPERAKEYVTSRIERKERIMGFGHRVYKTYDPRAKKLEELLRRLAEIKGATKMYDIAKEVEKHAIDRLAERGIYPNVDFYSGCIYTLLGIPTDLFTPIFAIARTAGWLAHWREYRVDNKLFRPTQIYVGGHDHVYKPINDR
jgi:citrate synthase